jgi:alpha-glucosidase
MVPRCYPLCGMVALILFCLLYVLTLFRFHYPHDPNTFGNQLQFFYGPSLLVSPVTEENVTTVDIYLPDDKYYSFFTLSPVEAKGKYVHLTDIPYTDIPLHIRGGSIIPLRISGANTTTQLRKKDFELLIAPDASGNAEGYLYLDDGESLEQTATSEVHFVYRENTLEVSGTFAYDVGSVKVAKITVLGESPVAKSLDVPLTGGFKVEIASLSEF